MPRRRRRSRFQNQIGLLNLIMSRRKEADVLRSSIPISLSDCVIPANFVLDAICDVFPVDKLKVKSSPDLTSTCVLILEGLVPALADPKLGKERARAISYFPQYPGIGHGLYTIQIHGFWDSMRMWKS